MTDGFDETLSLLFQPLEEKDGTLPLLSWMTDLLKIIGQNTRSISNDLLHQSIFSMYTLLNRLDDIMAELQRPGRDPRAAVEVFEFDPRVHEIGDLQVGMLLPAC